ncbi:hypothetical protein H0H81_000448 [Sphagnurus paluster]|uniref:NADP-dependent oxidoreductase domain-containing protein n=1 Tax=Sphagnurus paluster TaxID=117069 RepID=A0A9P7KHU6_9AGAR|nr:hypothetical protein H0H81_000448 [Sphagnurus paluster]
MSSLSVRAIDTAQLYRNEFEASVAIRESGLAREDIFITTKYSGLDGLDIATSINNSLKNLGVAYVDLYLIHHPRLAVPDIPTAWKQMELLKEQGLAKPITTLPGGPLDVPLGAISKRLGVTNDQILLAWVKSKGAIAVT